jgi:hypothetical protein
MSRQQPAERVVLGTVGIRARGVRGDAGLDHRHVARRMRDHVGDGQAPAGCAADPG